ncbi:glycosyltransferase [Aestuariibacter sp. GS-14]|uniref:glycosyltransferase family 2 protein n=1 Tax=Aestuariibacter sp. GS-14 TaxID=2590670 RepID=UPI0011272AA8|nr:glycosyltransferase [Aestuariibacter sp. GS-14]TPV55466.1 glycosyltransferase [Aestuariibacter sp. GS-14]
MLFSVVIPTRNRLTLMKDALRGLAAQTLSFRDFEVVVVDNGSTDGTFEALSADREAYPFALNVIRNPDCERGPAPARNLGVREARGQVIAFLDSDCRPDEDWLSAAAVVFKRHPSLSLATGVIDFKPEQVTQIGFFSRKTVVALEEHPTYPTANSFYKRDVFLAHGGFDESLSFPNIFGQSVEAADTDLAWRVRDGGGAYQFMPQAIVYHEVQHLPPVEWLLEPLRLFLLPALIKMHPALRSKLLTKGVFFYPPSAFYYLLAVLFVLVILFAPSLLIWLPFVAVGVAALKAGTLAPGKVAKALGKLVLNTIRNYVMCSALVYGSLRYRTLVL